MAQLEIPRSREMTDVCFLFEGDTGVFTLAGLDDDWESIDLRASPVVGREHYFPDSNGLDCMPLDLDASSTGFLHHSSDCSDFSRYRDLGTALDQPVLDLNSDDDDEMDGEEVVLVF